MAFGRRILSFGGSAAATFTLRFLGIAGGEHSRPHSSGNGYSLGGGGAGEYIEKTSLLGELSQNYQVIVGAGNGGDTTFRTNGTQSNTFSFQLTGNSGFGANAYVFDGGRSPGAATLNESAQGSVGFAGGNYNNPGGWFGAGGGGGAGGAGVDAIFKKAGAGGVGVSSDITGSAVFRGGGGGGYSAWSDDSIAYMSTAEVNASGLGGNGGGGRGGVSDNDSDDGSQGSRRNGQNGTANTGGGGGGRGSYHFTQYNGGSGVVIVRYPNTLTITVGSGLTSTTTTTGTDKVTTFTAGSDNISFA